MECIFAAEQILPPQYVEMMIAYLEEHHLEQIVEILMELDCATSKHYGLPVRSGPLKPLVCRKAHHHAQQARWWSLDPLLRLLRRCLCPQLALADTSPVILQRLQRHNMEWAQRRLARHHVDPPANGVCALL